MSLNRTPRAGVYKRKLHDLGVTPVIPQPAATPSGNKVAELHAPQMSHVCILNRDDYIAVTKLASCTGIALHDAASKVGAMYHFGGQFNTEQATLKVFAAALEAQHVVLGRLQMWLVGSTKCGFADKLLNELRALGFTQTPIVMEIDGATNPQAAFYLLGTGVVTNQLT
jgi:hypothetical protein